MTSLPLVEVVGIKCNYDDRATLSMMSFNKQKVFQTIWNLNILFELHESKQSASSVLVCCKYLYGFCYQLFFGDFQSIFSMGQRDPLLPIKLIVNLPVFLYCKWLAEWMEAVGLGANTVWGGVFPSRAGIVPSPAYLQKLCHFDTITAPHSGPK